MPEVDDLSLRRLPSPDGEAAFDVVGSRRPYEGQISDIRVDTLRTADGDEFEREVVEHIDAVAVVPLTADGEVVLVAQYRHAVGRWLWEIPAGVRDVDGEDPAETAARELAEEAAVEAVDYRLVATMHNSAGWTDETTSVYVATGARQTKRPDGFSPEHEEARIRVVAVPLAEAVSAVGDGRITDAKTIVGLLLAAGGAASGRPGVRAM